MRSSAARDNEPGTDCIGTLAQKLGHLNHDPEWLSGEHAKVRFVMHGDPLSDIATNFTKTQDKGVALTIAYDHVPLFVRFTRFLNLHLDIGDVFCRGNSPMSWITLKMP